MRVFLDTNVVISAVATRGLCADLFRVVVAEHELVVGEVVIEEVRRILRDRFKVPDKRVDDLETLLRSHEVVARPSAPHSLKVRDEADRWILASASDGAADVSITGDADLIAVRDQFPIKIVTPREFWTQLRSP